MATITLSVPAAIANDPRCDMDHYGSLAILGKEIGHDHVVAQIIELARETYRDQGFLTIAQYEAVAEQIASRVIRWQKLNRTPKDETPKTETPKTETPKDETPKTETKSAQSVDVERDPAKFAPVGLYEWNGEQYRIILNPKTNRRNAYTVTYGPTGAERTRYAKGVIGRLSVAVRRGEATTL